MTDETKDLRGFSMAASQTWPHFAARACMNDSIRCIILRENNVHPANVGEFDCGWRRRMGTEQMTVYSNEFEHILMDASYMLEYAIEAGIEVDESITSKIMSAEKDGSPYWQGPEAGAVVSAITKLASRIHPVTAETLRACRQDARRAILVYVLSVIILGAISLPTSIMTAVYNGLTSAINSEINEGNEAAVKLHSGAVSTNDLSNLQQLAISALAIKNRAIQLNKFEIIGELSPSKLPSDAELEINLSG